MRFLLKVKPDLERTNKSIVEGTFEERMQQILSHIKPEAAYFTEEKRMQNGALHRRYRESVRHP